MSARWHSARAWTWCAILGSTLAGQAPNPTSVRIDGEPTVQFVDGALWGAGRNFKIRFGSDSVEFVPVLGSAAPHNMPVRLAFEAIGREDGVAIGAGELEAPSIAAERLRVEYSRGAVTECYDVRADGVEQSFVVTRMPPGTGDLLVRLRLETELFARGDGETLDLWYGDRGSVHIGRVTGIDARGERAEGTVRLIDGHLELGLPGAFVDAAKLPLIVDPMLSSTIQVSSDMSVANERNPDIAYDRTNDCYLCVWQRQYSASDLDIIGQRISASGGLIGGQLLLETDGLVVSRNSRVANQNQNDMFVVVWEQSGDIWGRAVRASDGAIGPLRAVVTGTDVQREPALASDSSATSGSNAILVYTNASQSIIQGRTIHANETSLLLELFSPGIVDLTTPASGWSDLSPGISSHGGEDGVFLVVWDRWFSAFDNDEIRGKMIDRQLNTIGSPYFTITNTAIDEYHPVCDGDGRSWVVVYERLESGSFDTDLYGQSMFRDSGTGVRSSGEVVVRGIANDDNEDPQVAWLGNSAVVAWSDEVAYPEFDVYSTNLDTLNCSGCDGFVMHASSTLDESAPSVASRFSGGAATPGGTSLEADGFVIWEALVIGVGDGEIRGQRYTAKEGLIADAGGGCGVGGHAYAPCARTPHAGFEFQLLRAEPSRASWLILSPERRHYACGPCHLVADPFLGIVVSAGSTSAGGEATVGVPIPSSVALVGTTLYCQWLVAATAPTCAGPPVDMSNALRVQIQ